MFTFFKRRQLEKRISELVSKVCIATKMRAEYKQWGWDEYVKLEDEFIEKYEREVIELCKELKELSPA